VKSIVSPPSTLRTWFTALRPFAFTASVLPVLLGSILAWEAGFRLHGLRLGVLLASVVCLHGAANLLNDYFDFQRGLDRTVYPVSGALVRGWVTSAQIWRAALLLLCAGALLALVVIAMCGWGILLLAVPGCLLAIGYTRSGLCLKYAGLGDLAIFVAFGILPVLAGWWIQAGGVAWQAVWWGVPPGLLAVSILHANNWRDRVADAQHGCRTLAARMSPRACRRYWQALLASVVVFVILSVLAVQAGLSAIRAPAWVLLVLLVLPELCRLIQCDWAAQPEALAGLDARAARLHSVVCLLLCTGFILAGWLA